MKAIQQTKFGGIEVLDYVDVPVPTPGNNHVLIAVRCCGVNFADLSRREGTYGAKQLPQIAGVEVAGVRQDNGKRVVALLPKGGGYAEQALAEEKLVFEIPDDIDFETALTLFEQGITAYQVLHDVARVRKNESIVIQAGAGGVDSLAIQLARIHGMSRIIATASSEIKRELTLKLGADIAIDSSAQNLAAEIKRATGGKGSDVTLEMVGGHVFDESLKSLAPFGRIVVYGQASDQSNTLTTDDLMSGAKGVLGYWLWPAIEQRDPAIAALEYLWDRTRAGLIRPLVGKTYLLKDARQAHQDLASRTSVGKLLLDTQSV
jgi:NADPH:quinone reductase